MAFKMLNVLNNEKLKKEEEHSLNKISIKDKLAKKEAIIEHRDKKGRILLEKKE